MNIQDQHEPTPSLVLPSDLDEKLKEVQTQIGCCMYHMQSLEFRDEIRQVFKDAYWLPPEAVAAVQKRCNTIVQLDAAVKKYMLAGGAPDFIILSKSDFVTNSKLWPSKDHSWRFDTTGEHPEDTLMTGQEWYDRFEIEVVKTMRVESRMPGLPTPDLADRFLAQEKLFIAAAKKAAGLCS